MFTFYCQTGSLTTSADTIVGTSGNDSITGDKTTWAAGDVVVDGSSTDNDIYTLTMDGNIAAQTVSGVENIDVTIASVTANHTLDTASYAGVTELTVDRADVVVGGATITGGTQFQVDNVDASQVAKITTGGNVTVLDINSAGTDKAGLVVDATGVTGNVTVQGASTITANDSTASVSIDAVIGNATEDAKAASITAAKAATVSTHATLTGAITIDAAAATTTTVNNAAGGATVTAATAATAAATIAVKGIDNTGATVTTGTGAATTTTIAVNLEGTAATTDVATVNAAGVIALDAGAAATGTVDTLNLTGNGADVTYTITDTDNDGIVTIAGSGDYNVNVTGADNVVGGITVTGVNTLKINAHNAAVDLSNASATTIDINADFAGDTITVANGANLSITADQTTELDVAANAADDSITIAAGDDNGTSTATPDIVVTTLTLDQGAAFETVTFDTSAGKITAATATVADTTTDIVVTGSNDINLGTVTADNLDASGATGKVTVTSTTNLDSIKTGSAVDTITLNGNIVHTVEANAGNDAITVTSTAATTSIDGGAGNDSITINDADAIVVVGGEGDDTFVIGASIDSDAVLVGGNGTDTLDINTAAAFNATNNSNFTMSGIETLDVTGLNNTFTMTAAQFAANNTFKIVGTGTNDAVVIGDATATTAVTIDASNVTLDSGSDATLAMVGSTKADNITGGAMDETITLSKGADTIDGGAGTDTILTTGKYNVTDADSTDASAGVVVNMSTAEISALTVFGQIGLYTGNSVAAGTGTVNYLFAANKTTNSVTADTLQNIENVTGTAGKDYIVGSASDNVIDGGAEADYINGGAGDDTITGGTGIDTIATGDGSDTISFTGITAVANRDTVTDFAMGTNGDVLGLDVDNTTVATAADAAAVFEAEAAAAANANGVAYDLATALTADTTDLDLVVLESTTLTNIANADLSAATDGSELLKALVTAGAGNTASELIVDANADSFYILVSDATDSYLYLATEADNDAAIQADEIVLVGTLSSADADDFVAANAIMVA